MKFWDASAIVPLLINEPQSAKAYDYLKKDPVIFVWTLTPVECFSALFRKHRENAFAIEELTLFRRRLQAMEKMWNEVISVEQVKRRAERLLGSHKLRAADSLQLAAALVAFSDEPHKGEFVTFDEALANAATMEGFTVLN